MNRLKLYLAAHEAASKALETKPADLSETQTIAFKAAGGTAKQDFEIFREYFADARLHMQSLSKLKLPSEHAAETI